MEPQLASSCSTSLREPLSTRLSSGSTNAIDAKHQSKFLLEIWSTWPLDQTQSKATTTFRKLRRSPLHASMAWNTLRHAQLEKLPSSKCSITYSTHSWLWCQTHLIPHSSSERMSSSANVCSTTSSSSYHLQKCFQTMTD